MSSTNRSNARESHVADYYKTPVQAIVDFLMEFGNDYPDLTPCNDGMIILDPCAGGIVDKESMSYPEALRKWTVTNNIFTIDIREDSQAVIKSNYLTHALRYEPNCIITNPPFNIALDIIKKALNDVAQGGVVIMLLRLNFFGSQERKEWLQKNMPFACYVHSKRMNFTPGKVNAQGKRMSGDSIEYMHAVWIKGNSYPKFTKLRII